jgi:cell division protein FtsW (lipid II flippase)
MSATELRTFIGPTVISSNKSETGHAGKRAQKNIEFAIKVVVLAIPGFLIFMFCCLGLIVEILYGEPMTVSPLVGLPLAFVGALMILAGTGQWRRWAYLCVFLSIPIVALAWMLLAPFLPNNSPYQRWLDPKSLGMVAFALPIVVSYLLVRRYYRRRDARWPIQKELR